MNLQVKAGPHLPEKIGGDGRYAVEPFREGVEAKKKTRNGGFPVNNLDFSHRMIIFQYERFPKGIIS